MKKYNCSNCEKQSIANKMMNGGGSYPSYIAYYICTDTKKDITKNVKDQTININCKLFQKEE